MCWVKLIRISESVLSHCGHGSNRLAARILRCLPSQAQVRVAAASITEAIRETRLCVTQEERLKEPMPIPTMIIVVAMRSA